MMPPPLEMLFRVSMLGYQQRFSSNGRVALRLAQSGDAILFIVLPQPSFGVVVEQGIEPIFILEEKK